MELQIALFHAIETEDFAKVRKCVRNGVDLSDEWRNEQGKRLGDDDVIGVICSVSIALLIC